MAGETNEHRRGRPAAPAQGESCRHRAGRPRWPAVLAGAFGKRRAPAVIQGGRLPDGEHGQGRNPRFRAWLAERPRLYRSQPGANAPMGAARHRRRLIEIAYQRPRQTVLSGPPAENAIHALATEASRGCQQVVAGPGVRVGWCGLRRS